MPAKDMGRTGGRTTSGDDVQGMLGEMAQQIADAERRHLEQMRAMQQRLAELTRDTGTMPQPATNAPEMTDEAWDMASAEALTRMYEADSPAVEDEVPAFFLQDPIPTAPQAPASQAPSHKAAAPVEVAAPEIAQSAKPFLSLVETPAAPEAEPVAALALDRSWLDQRIEDIAARVEETLARNNPTARIADLDRRFGAFEDSFSKAMSGVATRADLEGLRVIETQIGDLTKRLEDTRGALRRIDGIEAELRKLTELAEQAQSMDMPAGGAELGAASHAMPDVAALVDTAADRVAERFAKLAPQSAAPAIDTSRLDQMQTMLATIAEERRREEHQTSSMLDTMQEALVRLIDRVDQLDPQRRPAGVAMGAPLVAEPPQQPDEEPAADLVYVENERGPQPGRRMTDHEAYTQSGVRHHDPELPEVQIPAAAAGYAAQEMPEAPAERPAVKPRPTRPAAQAQPQAQPQPQPQAQPQRAARTVEQPAAAAASTSKPVPPRATRQLAQPTVVALPDESQADETKEQSTLAKRGIMVAGIGVAIIAMGLLFEFFIKDRLLSNGAPKLAERAPAAAPANPTAAAQQQGPSQTPRFADEPETATPAAIRQPADGRAQPDPREAPAPQPGRGATDQPPQNEQPRPRSQLETSTGQPMQVGQVPQNAPAASASRAGAPPAATTTVQGIALQAPMTVNTTNPFAVQPAPATPKPTAQAGPSPITTASLPANAATAQAAVELPPALIGPLSLRLAAQKGDPEAQFEVAARFAEGKGVKQDFKQAMTWYDRSARAGFAPSQYRLGTLYERGAGGSPDPAAARYWYERAAAEGNTKAMHNLAVITAAGQTPDYATSIQWFTAAAERGLADSQFNLGVVYENGLGVARDQAAAYKWYALAAAKGDAEATRRRDAVVARLKPAEAQALAEEVANWRAKPTTLAANDARAAGAAFRARAEQAAVHAAPAEHAAESETAQPAPRPAPVKRSAPKTAAQTSFN